MYTLPEKFDKLDLSTAEKSFQRTLDRAFAADELAYYVLRINPRKKDSGNGQPELFNLLVIPEGIILFRFFNIQDPLIATHTIQAISNPIVYHILVSDIKSQLQGSRYLVDENETLRFSVNISFIMPDISRDKLTSLSKDEIAFCQKYVFFQDDIQNIRKLGKTAVISKLNRREDIHEDIINNIFQRLCPEITIPRKFVLDEHLNTSIVDDTLTELDRSVLSYRLDTLQIDIINRITKGNQLILACAGSGKSVLLISKCFRLASLNPSGSFLLTCYNRNLNNYYQWAIAQAGFTDKNVRCSTFYGLCKQLLERNSVALPVLHHNQEQEYYDHLFNIANEALRDGRIKERFYGIFIDEVQIFKPEWYRFCFNLLYSKSETEHFFIIAGDKSQDIKNNIKHGKAPWQGGGSEYPEYRGKTLPIEKNYRNSKPINDFIDRFVSNAKKFGETISVDISSDPELFLRGTAFRPGTSPSLIELDDLSNEGEAQAICNAIQSFLDRGYSEVDIAIILYNRKAKYTTKGWKTHYYNLLPYIRQIFYQKGWESPAVLIAGESEGATYGSRRGITITTIEGALGLDFSAVILAGLRPLGTHENAQTIQDFETTSKDKISDKREAYMKNVNLLYTGCTRAKNELSIVLSMPKGCSIYLDLLRQSIGG